MHVALQEVGRDGFWEVELQDLPFVAAAVLNLPDLQRWTGTGTCMILTNVGRENCSETLMWASKKAQASMKTYHLQQPCHSPQQ
jgi:hypothetical protein